ncbi:hypothetical protein [Bradyrhizobium sp. Arg237L]|uniref:hypothetical protein n=1 Tax=Bradyrhizobium sp. Arg237L TaxID=3003352 RepID=UPI0032B77DC4
MISSLCLSMISAQTLRVCREGKPVSTFPDHALRLQKSDLEVHAVLAPVEVAASVEAVLVGDRDQLAYAPLAADQGRRVAELVKVFIDIERRARGMIAQRAKAG